jgi:murein DD-endopeptidase MepM/ murein hydrolase activator NlpD
MSIDLLQNVPVPLRTESRPGEAPSDAERARLSAIAQEFEAMLMLQMVRQMRQSLLDEQEDQGLGLGRSAMTDTIDVELARYLAAAGGLGLARGIEQGLSKAVRPGDGGAGSAPAVSRPDAIGRGRGAVTLPVLGVARSTTPATVAPTSLAATGSGGETAFRVPLAERVSSAFGWRSDPFHGQRRFHGGIDIAAAYGREVPTAAPGRVVFAGEQGAYGLLVTVEHPDGVTTRYAHLSSIDVGVGEELASGQVVGRVGQTGRATGPHLHFEVLVDGRRVDPVLVAEGRVPGLKSLGLRVDYPSDRVQVSTGPANGDDHED